DPDDDARCDLKVHDIAVDAAHLAVHAAGGDHLIAPLEGFEQGPVLLGLLLLGADQQEIEDGEHEEKGENCLEGSHGTAGLGASRGCRHCKRDSEHCVYLHVYCVGQSPWLNDCEQTATAFPGGRETPVGRSRTSPRQWLPGSAPSDPGSRQGCGTY